jgi:ABC-type dipeptide/oligopeptide/nickel transport system permease component
MRRTDYIVKRILFAVVTVFVALSINFVLFRLAPGSAVTDLSRVPHATKATRLAIAREFGLDKSKWDQYVIYLKQLAHFNLGVSYQNSQPVWSNLKTDLANTIPMVTLGTLFSVVIGTFTGVIAAWRRGTALEKATVGSALGFYSMPTHWLALMLIILLGGTFPTRGMSDPFYAALHPGWLPHIYDVLRHMFLPALTLGLVLYGEYTLIVRSAMLETLGEDYILTARAKGLADWTIVRRHALRNAMLPIVTLIGLSLGYIVAGAILVETVFSWPGIGLAVYDAVSARDYPMLQGAFLVLTLSVVFFNLLADLLYLKLDPRITE